MFEEFLKSAAGHAVVGVLIAALAVLIIDLNYRLFFKYVLDFLFALITVVVLSPAFIACAAVSKYREGRVYDKTPFLGAGGKVIYARSYAGAHRPFKTFARFGRSRGQAHLCRPLPYARFRRRVPRRRRNAAF